MQAGIPESMRKLNMKDLTISKYKKEPKPQFGENL